MSDYWRGIVRWDNEDVIMAAFDEGMMMSVDQAIEWWDKHERAFKSIMTEYGNQVLRDMISDDVNETKRRAENNDDVHE